MKTKRVQEKNAKVKRRSLKGWIALAAAALIASVALYVLQGAGEEGAQTAHARNAPSLGDPDAPVTIIQYADFQCVYCRMFALDIQPDLVKEFVETGRARIEWRHFPIFGEFSTQAAHAAACAHEQGAFWEYHDALYEKVGKLSAGAKNVDTLVEIAGSVGLDTSSFRACVVEERYAEQISADFQSGREHGIVGTPSFLVNGRLLIGAHPMETWRRVIELVDPEEGA